nr:hypothetical protein CFP56_65846 [Quercus suber]
MWRAGTFASYVVIKEVANARGQQPIASVQAGVRLAQTYRIGGHDLHKVIVWSYVLASLQATVRSDTQPMSYSAVGSAESRVIRRILCPPEHHSLLNVKHMLHTWVYNNGVYDPGS